MRGVAARQPPCLNPSSCEGASRIVTETRHDRDRAADHPPAARRPGGARLRPAAGLLSRHLGPRGPSRHRRGIAFLAAEGSPEQYSVRLRQAADKRLDLIAFGAATPADVDTLAGRLGRGRGRGSSASPARCRRPGGGYGFRFFDNDGRTVEVSSDVAVRGAPRRSRRASRSRSSSRHVVINSPNPEAHRRRFYQQHLGFALSDTLMHPAHGRDDVVPAHQPPGTTAWRSRAARTSRCTTPRSRCAASTSTCAAPAGCCGPGWRRSGVRDGTWPATTRSATSSTRTGNTVEYTTELEQGRRGHLAPARVRLHRPDGHRPVGHREPDERVRRQQVVQRPRPGRVRRPAGLMGCGAVRFATWRPGRGRAVRCRE